MAFRYGMAYSPMQWFSGYVIATTMPSVSNETLSTRWLSLCEFKGLIPRVTLRSPWALLCRAVGTGFRFISAFTDRLVLCVPSDFFKSVFQFSSIFCSVLAQTVDEPFFCYDLEFLILICEKCWINVIFFRNNWMPDLFFSKLWIYYQVVA